MATIQDVAKLANVSTATVSRFISTPDKVSPKSSRRVQDAIDQLNYKPNLLARNFQKSRAYAILVLIPNISNTFLAKVVGGIESVGKKRGYSVLLGDTRYSPEWESEYFKLIDTRQADGFIQLSASLPKQYYDKNQKTPFVNACECIPDAPCPTFKVDNEQAAQSMTQYLLSMGHRKIACLTGPLDKVIPSPITHERLAGYKAALKRADIEPREEWLISGNFSFASGLAAASQVLAMEERPTAVFCFNDEMAIGLIRGLKNAGIKIPQDISVAGFDDMDVAKYCDPPLTTIAQPAEEIGKSAMEVLCDMLDGHPKVIRTTVLNTELIVRESTGVPPK